MTDQSDPQSPSRSETKRESEGRSRIVGGSWGISIVVVIAMIGAAVANVQMMASANTRAATLETKLDGTTKAIDATNETLKEIRTVVTQLASTTAKDVAALQRENSDLRERVTREVGELRLQIAEVRSAMLATGR